MMNLIFQDNIIIHWFIPKVKMIYHIFILKEQMRITRTILILTMILKGLGEVVMLGVQIIEKLYVMI